MNSCVIKSGTIINEQKRFVADILIKNGRIEKIASQIDLSADVTEINAEGKYVIPGMIDDQVHFREPGLTHKGNIYSESRAAVAGGITSFMEMPNTVPNTLTQALLEEKYQMAAKTSAANYSFYMGVSNDNAEEVLKTNPKNVCGVKIFMGSSTGNMLVDKVETLERLFSSVSMLIATHCEDEATVRKNLQIYLDKYGEHIPVSAHPIIRSEEACYLSSSFAVNLAKKYKTRLHVLHISTAKELELFNNQISLKDKHITAEACIHHLWFSEEDYLRKGNYIKWNPAIKKTSDRQAIWQAVRDGRIDVIATDHAPHTLEEKSQSYQKAPSGGPLVQHAVQALFEKADQGEITLEELVQKTSHNLAILFRIEERGYIREGYFADLVIVDPNTPHTVEKNNLLYHCAWSPFEGTTFKHSIASTFVNGNLVWHNGVLNVQESGKRLTFASE
jgi:dihydroorotase